MISMNERGYIELKRNSRKPYPIKGAWSVEKGYKGSPATRAIITKKGEENYEVEVYEIRGAWFEYSLPSDNIKSLEDAMTWLVEHYGGKWVED